MMGDLKKRASFARLVNYVNNPKKARLIDSKDVRLDDNAAIARSMQGQADDKPGRKLKNPVYHISLDFAHEDAPRLTMPGTPSATVTMPYAMWRCVRLSRGNTGCTSPKAKRK